MSGPTGNPGRCREMNEIAVDKLENPITHEGCGKPELQPYLHDDPIRAPVGNAGPDAPACGHARPDGQTVG